VINAAIIGLGWWGKNIVSCVQGKSAKLRFVHGVSKEIDAALPIAEANGFTLSDDLDKALADKRVEAVVLATPHSLHADQIVRVAAAGKPVFCEKPLSLKRADAERAVAACAKAGVPIGVGQNKRFWPSMTELRRVAESGVLGRVMHVEGHYSNENSGTNFSAWRDSPDESPGGGMTGTGIHLLDAFINLGGPAAEVQAQVMSFRGGHDPRDAASVMFRFANGLSGYFGLVRQSPFYWRVQVFGDSGSVEAVGETEVIVRTTGGKVERREFPKIDSLLFEIDAFSDAVAGRAPYPITPAEMVNTIAAFEAIIRSMGTGKPVSIS
jgi:predicted dehydrogenase